MARAKAGTCIWKYSADEDTAWSTECGEMFQLESDGPVENKMEFCCYCGRTLVARGYDGAEVDHA